MIDCCLIWFQIHSRKRGTKITFPWPGAEPRWRGPLKVQWNWCLHYTTFSCSIVSGLSISPPSLPIAILFNKVLKPCGNVCVNDTCLLVYRLVMKHNEVSLYSKTINKAEAKMAKKGSRVAIAQLSLLFSCIRTLQSAYATAANQRKQKRRGAVFIFFTWMVDNINWLHKQEAAVMATTSESP